ncbi:hypothetical protein KIW84_072834 [Lathyrus oleraceus]|uniref:Uncharacterized protein n=1 Tax=Pisum sativum TaxID=3888 RepID=A0A9D4ZUV3_PEA|nr:hypothetical protein KIW84_072834 [Pisum sativum]
MGLKLCEDSSEEDGEELVTELRSEVKEVEELKTLKLSLQSQADFTSNKSFKWGMEDNLIQGDPTLCNRKASWKATMKTLNNEGLGFFVQDVGGSKTVEVKPEKWSLRMCSKCHQDYQLLGIMIMPSCLNLKQKSKI